MPALHCNRCATACKNSMLYWRRAESVTYKGWYDSQFADRLTRSVSFGPLR